MDKFAKLGVEIPANQTITGIIDLGEFKLFAIELPATWAGTSLTFQAKSTNTPEADDQSVDDAENWKNVYDDSGNEVTVTVAANRIVCIDAAALKLAALRYIRIRSGTAAAPVGQNPSKPLKLLVKQ